MRVRARDLSVVLYRLVMQTASVDKALVMGGCALLLVGTPATRPGFGTGRREASTLVVFLGTRSRDMSPA